MKKKRSRLRGLKDIKGFRDIRALLVKCTACYGTGMTKNMLTCRICGGRGFVRNTRI